MPEVWQSLRTGYGFFQRSNFSLEVSIIITIEYKFERLTISVEQCISRKIGLKHCLQPELCQEIISSCESFSLFHSLDVDMTDICVHVVGRLKMPNDKSFFVNFHLFALFSFAICLRFDNYGTKKSKHNVIFPKVLDMNRFLQVSQDEGCKITYFAQGREHI